MIAERYDAFLFDLDGVLYRASEPVARRRGGGRGAPRARQAAGVPDEQLRAHPRGGGRAPSERRRRGGAGRGRDLRPVDGRLPPCPRCLDRIRGGGARSPGRALGGGCPAPRRRARRGRRGGGRVGSPGRLREAAYRVGAGPARRAGSSPRTRTRRTPLPAAWRGPAPARSWRRSRPRPGPGPRSSGSRTSRSSGRGSSAPAAAVRS